MERLLLEIGIEQSDRGQFSFNFVSGSVALATSPNKVVFSVASASASWDDVVYGEAIGHITCHSHW